MHLDNAVGVLARALHHACLVALPAIECPEILYRPAGPGVKGLERYSTGRTLQRRPREDEVSCALFPQTWGSTALGFGGIGGAAMTSAYTVVISHVSDHAVYFDGRLAYTVPFVAELTDAQRQAMREDMHSMQRMASCRDAPARYGAKLARESE